MRRNLILIAALIGTPAMGQQVTTIASDLQGSGDLSVGPDGKIYLADFGSSLRGAGGREILRMDSDGENIAPLNGEFRGASGNEFGADGALYQSDVARGQAWRVTMDGKREMLGEGMAAPVGITADGDGGAYVVECVANRVTRVGHGENEVVFEGEPLNCPNGLTTGPDGKLYAVNFRDGGVVRVDPETGTASLLATLPGGGNGHVTVANDRLYAASFRGGRIYSVGWDGSVCLIAGSGERAHADGAALQAAFFRPNGIAPSADGDTLFVNSSTAVVPVESPLLHLNAVRRIEGVKQLLDCPADRRVEAGEKG